MANSTNLWQVGTQGVSGRAIATLAIAMPITLAGKDANGVEFTERTRTIVIDRFGGKIATKCVLRRGSEMTLHNPIVGQTARIKVVWVGDKRAADELYEIGVQLVGSQNIWGIEFPSYGRQESTLPASRLKIHSPGMPAGAASCPRQPTALKFAVPDSSSSLKPGETGGTAPSATPPTMQTQQSTLSIVEEHVKTLGFEAQLQKAADQVAETAAKQLQRQAEDTLLMLDEELKTSGDNCTKRLEESLAKAENEQEKQALNRFRKALEQGCTEALARMKSDLAQALQAASEQAARQAGALNDLRQAVEENSLQTLAKVRGAATQTIGEISGQIEGQANALADLREAVQEESTKTLAKAKSDANQAIREASEQVARDTEALDGLRKSLVEESARALPKFQEDLGRAMGEVTDQVQQ